MSGSHSGESLPVRILGRSYHIVFVEHLFKNRVKDNRSRIGGLSRKHLKKILQKGVTQFPDILEKREKFVVSFPRQNKQDLYSAILYKKEGLEFITISIFHSEVPYKNLFLFPREKTIYTLTEKEVEEVWAKREVPIYKQKESLIRPLKKVIRKTRRVPKKSTS